MKNIVPYILVFFLLLCTACNTDDTAIPSHTQITKEQKELVLGNWQLMYYTNLDGDQFDLRSEGVFVRYTFTKDGTVTIENASSKRIRFTHNSQYLTSNSTSTYGFDYVKSWEKEAEKKERLYFHGSWLTLGFDLEEVTKETLILTLEGKETLVFKRLENNVSYPKISEEDKIALAGTWRLTEISDFKERKRVLNDSEDVFYDFTFNEKLVINNRSAARDGVFDQFVKMTIVDYSYQFDFEWHKREIMRLEELGDYAVSVTNQTLILSQFDGYLVKLERVR